MIPLLCTYSSLLSICSAIMKVVLIENFLLAFSKRFQSEGPRRSITRILYYPQVELQQTLGIPLSTVESFRRYRSILASASSWGCLVVILSSFTATQVLALVLNPLQISPKDPESIFLMSLQICPTLIYISISNNNLSPLGIIQHPSC